MSRFDPKEEDDNVLNFDALEDPEKSLGNGVPLSSSSTCYTSALDNNGETASTYTARESSSYFDPNYDDDDESVLEDDSPYPEVRSAVANFDDPDMPVSTLRAWVLGLLFAILLPGMNQFFYFRFPSVSIGGLVAQLLAFPAGRAWVYLCPDKYLFGIPLNPGPFTIKEHVLVTVMASVGAQSAYATDIIAVQQFTYKERWPFAYGWMLVMSTQLIGFSIGGIARRFLVAPPSMIWPNTLVSCALFNTLHSQTYAGIGSRDGLSRERYFAYVFLGAVVWYVFPGYLFQALSTFTWVCWIAPNNVKLNQVFGYKSGLGLSFLTFDWNVIAYIGSPLATPWWAEANVMVGFVFFFWILTPILYYQNVWYAQYMPILSPHAYDRFGKQYNVTEVLDNEGNFDQARYEAYSPLYLPIAFAMSYGLSFMSITATISHAIIYFWKPVRLQMGRSMREQPDVHARLMARYPQVPEWYYVVIFAITFAFACVCVSHWPTHLPIWALVIALLISLVYVIPIGMIQAITNRQVGLNVITELIIGFMRPGRPNAMMIFKTYGYITMAQAMQFTADFKLGHYMKVPPRPMFWCQVVATSVAGTVQLGVQRWMFSNIKDMCTESQPNKFTCQPTQVFATASVVWGVIGPNRQFSRAQTYYGLTFFFLIGAACPVILWGITKRYPRTILNYANFPLIFSGVGSIPPATLINYIPWAAVGFIFQYVIRRRHFSYWAKYNYVLSAALDAGTALGVILVFFCLQYPLDGKLGENTIQKWWGNVVFNNTSDSNYAPLRTSGEDNPFGLREWQ